MKRLISLILLIALASPAMGLAFSPWVAEGDYWKAYNDTYIAIKYNATGNHTFVATGNASRIISLVQSAGAGGGGTTTSAAGAGGGGAGGLIENATPYSVTGSYTVAIGTGGTGSTSGRGTNGTFSAIQNSTFAIAPIAGGTGGGYTGSYVGPFPGGSGGGGCGNAGASGTAGQGNAGGTSGTSNSGGGGGGAVSAGGVGNSTNAGNGGHGYTSAIMPGLSCQGGGGAGGTATGDTAGTATCGGGVANTAGTPESGGGGGGETSGGTGGAGGSGVVILLYEIPPGTFPNASFSAPGSTLAGYSTPFNDTSTYYPTAWNWSFGDGAYNNSQNTWHSYAAMGTYPVCLNASNLYGFNSSCANINVYNATVMTGQDVWLQGMYTQTFHVTDASSLQPIGNCTILTSQGQTNTTGSDGYATLSVPFSLQSVRFSAEGYSSRNISYVFDDEDIHEVSLSVPSTPSSSQSTWYTPHEVRLEVWNTYGNKMRGINVTAVANGTSLPSGWLQDLYGLQPVVANNMTNGTLLMSSFTGGEGAVVFTMHRSINYRIQMTNPTSGATYSTELMPQDEQYILRMQTNSSIPNQSENVYSSLKNTMLTFSEPNNSYVTMGLNYTDTLGRTSSLKFYVFFENNRTVVYTVDLGNPGTGTARANYTTRNIRGVRYIWNYTAVRS